MISEVFMSRIDSCERRISDLQKKIQDIEDAVCNWDKKNQIS